VLALAAGAVFATAAQAQQGPSGVVIGVAGGISKYNESCEGTSVCDTTDRAIRFNVGYGFGNGLVVEAVSFNFGKLKGVASGVSVEIATTANGAGVAYYAPLGSSSALFGRLGLAQVKGKATLSFGGASGSDSDTNSAMYAGLGFAWNLTPSTAIEVAWETTQLKSEGEKLNVSAATVGVSFRF
jgi:OmpA-OmpF porin, OOP family